MSNQILFVAFSHSLTQSQIDGFNTQFGDATITTLKEVAPELQQQMSNIPATATLEEIQSLAKSIVVEAVKAGATHFFATGEPTLTMWANLYAGESPRINELCYKAQKEGIISKEMYLQSGYKMVCLQSTTERKSVLVTNPDGTVTKTAVFQHVQWREMF